MTELLRTRFCAVAGWLVAVLLLAPGCGSDRDWSHPCDPEYGTLTPVKMDMVAIDTDCWVSAETGLVELSGLYLLCGKHNSYGWCAVFLDFRMDSTYSLEQFRDAQGNPPDRVERVTLSLSLVCEGGGTVDVLPWRDADSIPGPLDIDIAEAPWWTLATFCDDGVKQQRITLTLQAPVIDWLLNESLGDLTGLILYPRSCLEDPDSEEGHWLISITQVPHLQILAVRED